MAELETLKAETEAVAERLQKLENRLTGGLEVETGLEYRVRIVENRLGTLEGSLNQLEINMEKGFGRLEDTMKAGLKEQKAENLQQHEKRDALQRNVVITIIVSVIGAVMNLIFK